MNRFFQTRFFWPIFLQKLVNASRNVEILLTFMAINNALEGMNLPSYESAITGKCMNLPSYFPVLFPCHCFLWDAVYCQNPTSLAEPQQLISQECADISDWTLHKVCDNFFLKHCYVIVMNERHSKNYCH